MRRPMARRVELRAWETDMLRWQEASQKAGCRSVSDWIRRTLNDEAAFAGLGSLRTVLSQAGGPAPEITSCAKTVLENGVVVVTEAIPGVRSISMGVLMAGGLRDEADHQAGLAHVCEHLLFEGTSSRDSLQIARHIDGAGGQVGGFTARDYTCFYGSVLDDYSFHALDLLGDLLMNSIYPEQGLERQKRAILREIEGVMDSPDRFTPDLLRRAVFADHPAGRPIAGSAETVSGFTREDIIHFIHENYTPDRMIVAAAGNVLHDDFVAQTRDVFWRMIGRNPRPASIPPDPRPALAFQRAPFRQTYFCAGLPAPCYAHPDRYAAHIWAKLLGGSISSRLFRSLREERGLVYDVHAAYQAYQDAGLITIEGSAAPEELELVLNLLGEILVALIDGTEPPGEEELLLARNQLRAEYLISGEGVHTRMSRLATQEFYFGRTLSSSEILCGLDSIGGPALAGFSTGATRPALGRLSLAVLGSEPRPRAYDFLPRWLERMRAAGSRDSIPDMAITGKEC